MTHAPRTDEQPDDLRAMVVEGFARVDTRLDAIDTRFDRFEASVDARFEQVDARFNRFEAQVDARFDKVDARFDKVDARFDKVEARFDRFEAKMDDRFEQLIRTMMVIGGTIVAALIGAIATIAGVALI